MSRRKYFIYVWVNKFQKHEKKKKCTRKFKVVCSVCTNLNHITTCNPLFRLRVFIFGIFSRVFTIHTVYGDTRRIVITFSVRTPFFEQTIRFIVLSELEVLFFNSVYLHRQLASTIYLLLDRPQKFVKPRTKRSLNVLFRSLVPFSGSNWMFLVSVKMEIFP